MVSFGAHPKSNNCTFNVDYPGCHFCNRAIYKCYNRFSTGTKYYVRAYATNTAGTGYGADQTFTTTGVAPIVTTQPVTGIGTVVATGNGNITYLGAPNPTQYGVVGVQHLIDNCINYQNKSGSNSCTDLLQVALPG